MTPTIEEVKRVADECGMIKYQAFDFTKELWLLAFQSEEQLQAFAQHYIEEGRKEQREEIAALNLTIKELREALNYVHPYFIPGRECSDRNTQQAEALIEEALAKSEDHNSKALEKMLLEARIDELEFAYYKDGKTTFNRLIDMKYKLDELNKE